MNKKELPRFKNELEEQEFWQNHDSTDYIDWSSAKVALFPNLKPSTETISLRLPKDLLEQIKILANKKDVPYQSLMKVLLIAQIRQEQLSHIPTFAVSKQDSVSNKRSIREAGAVYSANENQGLRTVTPIAKATKRYKPATKSEIHSVSSIKKTSKSRKKTLITKALLAAKK